MASSSAAASGSGSKPSGPLSTRRRPSDRATNSASSPVVPGASEVATASHSFWRGSPVMPASNQWLPGSRGCTLRGLFAVLAVRLDLGLERLDRLDSRLDALTGPARLVRSLVAVALDLAFELVDQAIDRRLVGLGGLAADDVLFLRVYDGLRRVVVANRRVVLS